MLPVYDFIAFQRPNPHFRSSSHPLSYSSLCTIFIRHIESAVPGAYQQKCMNLDERSFHLESSSSSSTSTSDGGDTITVYQGSNASGGGMAGRTGGEYGCCCG